MERTHKTLHVDRRANPGSGRVRSRDEALALLLVEDYDAIVLYSDDDDRDDSGLLDYLAATWPDYLRSVKVRRVAVSSVRSFTPRKDIELAPPRRQVEQDDVELHSAIG
jgi:hypothetical protein